MAGVLYGYRLLVNIVDRGSQPDVHKALCEMSYKLYRLIAMPAMGVAYIAGIAMIALNTDLLHGGWLHVKLACVLALTASTIYIKRILMGLEQRATPAPTSTRLRVLNEVPTILMMIIVWMVVFKPF